MERRQLIHTDSTLIRVSAVVLCSALFSSCASDSSSAPKRIGDLDNQRTQVQNTQAEPLDESEALENYRRYLELADDSKERQEALRRVADLKVEVEDAGQNSTTDVDSVAYYEELLHRYPNAAANDRVLYQLARAHEINGDPQQALATFDRLIREYPNSGAMTEVRFRRAELLFQQRQYPQAEQAYAQILSDGKGSRFYEKALYKQGWSRYKQSRYVAALGPFDQLLRDHPTVYIDTGIKPGSSSQSREILLDDSLRTMALSLSLLGDADRALGQIDQLNNPPYDRALRFRLASLYEKKQRFTDAARVFETESERGGSADDALKAIAAFEAGGFDERAIAAKASYLRNYGKADPERSEAWSKLLARHHHARAQREKDTRQYTEAEFWYRYYLQNHNTAEGAGELNFLLAELLFEQQRYEQAAAAYADAAKAGGGRAGDAAYAAVLARRGAQQRRNQEEQAQQLPAVIAEDLQFSDDFPDHPQAKVVRLRAAEDLFASGQTEAASKAAEPLVKAAEGSIRLGALQIIGAHAAASSNYALAEEAFAAAIPLLELGEQRSEVETAMATALYRQAEQAREAGDSNTAIDKFRQISRQAPNAPIRAEADYDAASLLLAEERWDEAAGLLEAFRGRFPDHPLAAEAQRKLAIAYQNSGRKLEAARALTSVAQTGNGDVAQAADWQAAELLREAGADAQAKRAYTQYLTRYPADFTRGMEARRYIANYEAQTGKGPAYRRLLEGIIQADANADSDRSDRSRTLAAEASMELAMDTVRAFDATRIQLPLNASLKKKSARLDDALSALTRTANYGIAGISTAATFQIAELYRKLSAELIESPRPRNLDAEALDQYAVLLEERAFPFEEQAIEIHERNIARAKQGDYDEWISQSYDALAKLAPAQYRRRELASEPVEKW